MSDSSSPAGRVTPVDIVGEMAGEYRLRRKLGEGGFGAVYEAEHPLLRRRAAVKVLHQLAGGDSDAVLRFIAEARAVNQIRSPHIIDVFSFGQISDGRHFYVMDLLDGEPLDACLRRETHFDVPTAIQILRAIAEALDAAHAAGIVHRDLKPQNVFLAWGPNGETVPKLLDFGMAKLLGDSPVHTLSGTPVGTPLYMSPEQSRGESVDGRADVYALGVLCHELLTGQLPFTGATTMAVLMAHILAAPTPASQVRPELGTELDQPILRMLEKDPNARPATATAAIADLARAAERAGHVIPAGMPHLPRPATPPVAAPDDRSFSDSAAEQVVRAPTPQRNQSGQGAAASNATAGAPGARWPLWALLVAVAGIVVYLVVGKMSAPPSSPRAGSPGGELSAPSPTAAAAPVAVPLPPVAAPAPVVTPPTAAPTPADSNPRSIELTLRGAPRGARVSLDGRPLGDAPGPVPLPFGETPLRLAVTAPGHEPTTVEVVPNRASTVTVKMKRRGSGPPGSPARTAIPRDLENPF